MRFKNVTTHGRPARARHGETVPHGLQGEFKVPAGGDRPFPAKIHIAIIDAPPVNQPAVRPEHRGFRGDRGTRAMHEPMLRITERSSREGILAGMERDYRAGNVRIRIDQPEGKTRRGVFVREPLQFGGIVIGDRAIGPQKEEYQPPRARGEGGKRVNRVAGKILQTKGADRSGQAGVSLAAGKQKSGKQEQQPSAPSEENPAAAAPENFTTVDRRVWFHKHWPDCEAGIRRFEKGRRFRG